MALQIHIDDLDSVSETLRTEYVPEDPADLSKGYRLLLDNPTDSPETKSIKEQLRKTNAKLKEFRDNNTNLVEQLKARPVAAPVAAAPVVTPAVPATPAAQTAPENVVRDMIEPIKSRYEQELQQRDIVIQQKDAILAKQAQAIEQSEKHSQILTAMSTSGLSANSTEAYNDLVSFLAGQIRIDPKDGKPYVIDPSTDRIRYSGKNAADPMTVNELILEASMKRSYYFAPSRGGNAAGSAGLGTAGKTFIAGAQKVVPRSEASKYIKEIAAGTIKVAD